MAATVPSFDDVFSVLLAKLQGDAAITAAGIPVLDQDDTDYDEKYERALAKAAEGEGSGPGMCFVLWNPEGSAGDGNDAPRLALGNKVLLAIVEHRKNNTSGKTARQWCGHAIRLIHRGDAGATRGRPSLRIPASGPAYEIGGMDHGLLIYFAHFDVRTAEDVGVPPVAP